MKQIKQKIFLFTDGSVNPQSGVGVGAYLFVEELELTSLELQKKIKTKKFYDTSSTSLELETLLWALNQEGLKKFKIIIFTDCQNIITLEDRREKLEKKDYHNARMKKIKNHLLYKSFFARMDSLDCELVKLKGHKKESKKSEIDKIFTLVDKASRRALREI